MELTPSSAARAGVSAVVTLGAIATPAFAGSRDTGWCCTSGDGNTWSDGTAAPATTAEFGFCYYPSSGDGRNAEGVKLMRQKAWYQPDDTIGTHDFKCSRIDVNHSNYDFYSYGNVNAGTYYLRFTHSGNLSADDIHIEW